MQGPVQSVTFTESAREGGKEGGKKREREKITGDIYSQSN